MITAKKQLIFDPAKCIGCRLCEQWCVLSHFNTTNPKKARIRIHRAMDTQEESAEYCHQCENPPCIEACKFDALTQDPTTFQIIVNSEKCTGCQLCRIKCPHHAPIFHPEEKLILICDLCSGQPMCVSHCPESAIIYADQKQQNEGGKVE